MERRLIESEVRVSRGEDGQSTITGTAAVFYDPANKGTEYDLAGYGLPGVKERIMPGAFKRALGRGQGGTIDRNQDVYAAINHDPSLVFARTKSGTLKITADEQGLHYTAKPSDTNAGRDAVAHTQAGDFGGSSFAFQVAKNGEKWTMDGDTEVREIHKIDQIVDVSPVTSPAYKSTTVNARSADECRASYEAWKATVQKDISDLKELHSEIGELLRIDASEDEEADLEEVSEEKGSGKKKGGKDKSCPPGTVAKDGECVARAAAVAGLQLDHRHVVEVYEEGGVTFVGFAAEAKASPDEEVMARLRVVEAQIAADS